MKIKRFQEWEQRKWDRIVDRITTQSNDSTLPKVEFEDIVSGEGRLNKDVSSKLDDRKGIIFAPDQILFGKLRPYLQNWLLADFKGIALGDFWVFDTNKHSSLFVYYLMQSTKYQTIANLSSGTKMPRSDWKTVSQTEFSIPKDRAEEYQIGILFENLDSLITLHQQKYELLLRMKQAYLQLMFPQTGESTPQVRFADFHDNWEQRKLGQLADIVRGASPRPIQSPKWFDENSEVGWLRIADVTEQDGRIHNLEQRISEAGQTKTRVLTEPHLLLSIAATVGKPVINYVKTGVHDGFLIFMNPKFDMEFLFQWLEMFRPSWQKYGQPGSQVNLNSDLVKTQDIMLPNLNEQTIIGEFLAKVDQVTTLHQQKIASLKSLKQAYLQKMFV